MRSRCRLNLSRSVCLRLASACGQRFISAARCVAKWNAGGLDDVDDVDANAWPDVAGFGHQLSVDVAGNDGGHDAAVCVADFFENKTPVRVALFHGVRILCGLARGWCWNLCDRRG